MELSMVKGQVGYGIHPVLEELDFSLEPGGCIGLIGPNGAGKSTLLKTLAGIQPPLGGQILLDGKALEQLPRPVLSRKIAYLPQERELSFGYTAREAVLMGRYPHLAWYQQENGREREMAQDCLTLLGLAEESEQPVTALSGGQRQRVLLARVLIQQAPVILLDEPTAELDPVYEALVLRLCRRLAQEGRTVLLSLHDLELAARCCDRLLLVGRGRLLGQGMPWEVLEEKKLEQAYGAPFQVRREGGVFQVAACPEPDARREQLLQKILEERGRIK